MTTPDTIEQRAEALWHALCDLNDQVPWVDRIASVLRRERELALNEAEQKLEWLLSRFPEPEHRTEYAQGGVESVVECIREIRAMTKEPKP